VRILLWKFGSGNFVLEVWKWEFWFGLLGIENFSLEVWKWEFCFESLGNWNFILDVFGNVWIFLLPNLLLLLKLLLLTHLPLTNLTSVT
jgi:hypothetical protein